MTPDDYKAALARLGLNISSAARLFRVNVTTSQKWAAGQHRIPAVVQDLLAMLEAQKRGEKVGGQQ